MLGKFLVPEIRDIIVTVSVLAPLAGFSTGGAGPGGLARELALH